MELEKSVMAELSGMDLYGVKVTGLLCDAKTVQVCFEIGSVTIDCTTISEGIFQIDTLTHAGEVFVADEETLSQCSDWVKYVCMVIHPLIRKYRDQLPLVTPESSDSPESPEQLEEAEQLEQSAPPEELTLNEALKVLQETNEELKEARQEIAQLRNLKLRSDVGQQDATTGASVPSTRKKILSVVGSILFYLGLVATVLGVSFFGLQEPGAPPRVLAGHSMMTVLSRSMEPTLPLRALVVARWVDPNLLEIDDVVTYIRPDNATVTHRIIDIIENYQGTPYRGFRLRGDNNAIPDRYVVGAENIVGEIVFSNLFLGLVVFFIQQNIVLIVVFIVLGIALMYVVKKFFLNGKDASDTDLPEEADETANGVNGVSLDGEDGDALSFEQEEVEGQTVGKKKKYVRLALLAVLIIFFSYSAYRVLSYHFMYRRIEAAGAEIRQEYTQVIVDQESARNFLAVDWDGLLARNSDVVAWLHVPGTVIHYPVLAGATNETYLRTSIDGLPSEAGSVFLEENNESTFLDLHTIIYGHNMLNGSKFADVDALVSGDLPLSDVQYVYLYLPDGTVNIYQIVGGQLTDIFSMIYHLPVENLAAFYELMLADNVLDDVAFDRRELARVLTLSTCAEVGGSPVRSVIFAVLVDEVILN